MKTDMKNIQVEINALVDSYRARCLWFLKEDYYPADRGSMLRVLSYVKKHGDRRAFSAAGRLSKWLSQHTSEESAR